MTEIKPPVRLEQLRLEHAPDMFALLETQNEDYILPGVPWAKEVKSLEDMCSLMRTWDSQSRHGTAEHFGIFALEKLVGHGCLATISNSRHTYTEAGYWVAENESGKGYATEALRQLAGIAFTGTGLRSLSLRTSTGNMPSNRVAEKNGFILMDTYLDTSFGMLNFWIKERTTGNT